MQWELVIFSVLSIVVINLVSLKYVKHDKHHEKKERGVVRVLRHVPGRLAEYQVSGDPFSVTSWLNLTAVIAALLFWLGLHTQEDWVLVTLLASLSVALLVKLHLKVRSETLLVESSLGVQLTTVFASGRRRALCITRGRLTDVVVAEALTMHRVVTYLAIVRRDSAALVPLFRHTWPRRRHLESMYTAIQHILQPGKAEEDGVSCS